MDLKTGGHNGRDRHGQQAAFNELLLRRRLKISRFKCQRASW